MLMLSLMATVLASQQFYVGGREPQPASPWIQITRAKCGDLELIIAGYGAARPIDRKPELTVNGAPVTGAALPQLIQDLSRRRAAYRMQVLCSEPGEITVRLNLGEKQPDGVIVFKAGAALIRDSRLISYGGLQNADAKSFWFR